MNTATNSIQQRAIIRETSGNVQLIRDGSYLPAQAGMSLVPGDRLLTDPVSKAVIRFTGVNDALVIENGAAATFNTEMVEFEQGPQWIATDLEGEGVYFDALALAEDPTPTLESDIAEVADTSEFADASDTAGNGGMFGLFGAPAAAGAAKETTGYPILESVLFLGATAAIFSDNEDNPTMADTSGSGGNGSGGNGSGGGTTDSGSTPDGEAAAGPLDSLLGPLTGILDGLTGSVGGASPLGSLTAPQESSELLNALNMANLS